VLKSLFADKNRFWQSVVITLGVVIAIIQFVQIAKKNPGDFYLHWRSGELIATGEFLYVNNHNYPYPPFWGFVHAPLASFSMQTAYLLIYPLFFISLFLLIWVLNRMSEAHFPLLRNQLFWVLTAAIFLASRYLIRDMLECGVNLALVALSWLGVYLWSRKKELWGSIPLGFAMALKCTPSLFWIYFILKREWKMAIYTFLAAAFFTLSPMLKLGYTEYRRTFEHWGTIVARGMLEPNPIRWMGGEIPLANMSFKPALARYLMHFPKEHEARLDSPLYIDFLDLSPQTSLWIIKAVMLCFLVFIGWKFRRHYEDRNDERILWECAIISIMILLYSPVTWGQHCVGIFPGMYLLVRCATSRQNFTRPLKIGIGLFVFLILILNRTFIGKFYSEVMSTYHIATFAFIGIIFFLLKRHENVTREQSQKSESVTAAP
jgi:alpha-1,2-mannosyltransferase